MATMEGKPSTLRGLPVKLRDARSSVLLEEERTQHVSKGGVIWRLHFLWGSLNVGGGTQVWGSDPQGLRERREVPTDVGPELCLEGCVGPMWNQERAWGVLVAPVRG